MFSPVSYKLPGDESQGLRLQCQHVWSCPVDDAFSAPGCSIHKGPDTKSHSFEARQTLQQESLPCRLPTVSHSERQLSSPHLRCLDSEEGQVLSLRQLTRTDPGDHDS